MKTKSYLLLIVIMLISAMISCTGINNNMPSTTLPSTSTPKPTSTPLPTLSPTPEPTATSVYYGSLNADQQKLYNSAPNMIDKGWDKSLLPEPFENYLGYYSSEEVVAIYDSKTDKVLFALLINNNLLINESKSAITYNPAFSKDEARTIFDNVMQWYRIRLCTSQKSITLPNNLEDVLSSTKFQDYLDDCTITLRSWTYRKTLKDRDEGCAPYYYSVPKQTLTVSKDSGIIIWLNSKRIENTVNVCLAKFDSESNPPKVLGYYLGTAVGIDQVSGGPIEISVNRSYDYRWDNYSQYKLADSLNEALKLTSMRIYKVHQSDSSYSQLDDNFNKIMGRWIIEYFGFYTKPPLIYKVE